MALIELLEGERVIVGIRKHWLVFVLEMFGLMIAALIPFILSPFVGDVLPELSATLGQSQLDNAIIFTEALWLLIIGMILFVALTSYYLDILIVTNMRIIDIDQIGLFARDVATAPLHNVEDVKIQALGVFATLFRFGNLQIQTAAETKEIVIRGIRHPERAKDLIMRAYQEAIARANPKM